MSKYYFDIKTNHIVSIRPFGDASISCIPVGIFDTRLLNRDTYVIPNHLVPWRLIPYDQTKDRYNLIKLLYL